jgi:hypothetical protein
MDLDPTSYKNIFDLRNNPDLESLYLDFTRHAETGDGENIVLTKDNVEEYIERWVHFNVTHGRKEQMEELREGLQETLGTIKLEEFFTAEELKGLVEGIKLIDIDDWKKHSVFKGFDLNEKARYKKWFWKIVESSPEKHRLNLLKFVTGSSKVPVGGFSRLSKDGREIPFTIEKFSRPADRNWLPTAQTCTNTIYIPAYKSYKNFKSKFVEIITHSEYSEGFGLS